MSKLYHAVLLALCIAGGAIAQDAGEVQLAGLEGKVEVFYDGYGVPHLFAASWPDAYRTLGSLHAEDRLWQMDLYRRRASGTLAEVMGKAGLEEDILVRRLGILRGCQAFWDSDGPSEAMREALEAYCAGVNAKMDALRAQQLLPFPPPLAYDPAPWTPVDCMVFFKYMGWDQSGNDDDLWFGTVVEKLGAIALEELWPLERPYETPTVSVQVDRTRLDMACRPAAPEELRAYQAAREQFPQTRWLGESVNFGSNNWAVSGSKTASGKPILCSDPHMGFQLPSIWYAWHLSVRGRSITGVGFPGCPLTIIGHNDFLGWGITNLQADAVDYFVETVDENDPMRYRHRGEWKQMTRVTEAIPVRGEAAHVLDIDSTVHGPVITREGRTVAMQWTGQGATRELLAMWIMNRASTLEEWLGGVAEITVPGLNLAYADVHGNIALCCCGRFPVRARGQGRVPMDGASGGNDWTAMIPVAAMPLSVNPPEGFVASANGRPTPVGYPHYLGWMWDPSYRKRRIDEMLTAAQDLTIETMAPIQYDHRDKAAERFVPVLLEAIGRAALTDAFAQKLARALAQWDFVADVDAVQPVIWLRWLDHYRKAVWDDEWKACGLEKRSGSWGFTGINGADPEMEVLEYMTREHPDSVWFDNKTTPERERRDDILVQSFLSAAASLKEEFGDDLGAYAWGSTNVLKIRSLSGVPELGRTGGSVPGTPFTPNPGGGIGSVGGGASWRMIVDFATPDTSVGVYPGGQSSIPDSPNYADLMPLWEKGKYLPLHLVATPDQLPAGARAKRRTFTP